MSSGFNLFSIHSSTDIHPRSWICVQGETLKDIVARLERDVLRKHEISREHLSRELSKEFRCALGVIKRVLQGGSTFYPIVVLQKLLMLSSQPRYFSRKIRKSITKLKVNSASSKPVTAVYNLSGELAKIIGAFAADGSLSIQLVLASPTRQTLEALPVDLMKAIQTSEIQWSSARKQYYIAIKLNERSRSITAYCEELFNRNVLIQTHHVIELTDEYEDNVRAFARWIDKTFGVKPTSFDVKRGKRAWRVIFSNKILARYLTEFFGMKSGFKTYTVREPEIIKNSKLDIRREFAKGALMFDGCVTKGGKVTFSTKSRDFTAAIQEIWKKDKIACGVLSKNNRDEYTVTTTIPNSVKRLLRYFEPDTQKWKLLHWINGNADVKPIFKKDAALSAEKVLALLNKVKSCDIHFLEQNFEKRYTSIRHYLRILIKHKKIRITRSPHVWSDYINEKTTVYLSTPTHNLIFGRIKEKLGKGKNAATVLGVHNATFSAWKKQKNGIPIEILQKLAPLLEFELEELAKAVIRTDRDVIELI